MPKLTVEDLKNLREGLRDKMNIRSGEAKAKVIVHLSTCGIAAGAREILKAFMDEIEKRGITDILVTTSSCAGLCSKEPMITVIYQNQAPVKYIELTPQKVKKIFEEHLLNGNIVKEFALASGSETTA
jgi:NADP-reducing hydrogenase subunit HndB